MSVKVTDCSSEGCDEPPVEALFLRDQVGHVHDCREHSHLLREWCDVVGSRPIVDGECSIEGCTGDVWIAFAPPAPLGDSS